MRTLRLIATSVMLSSLLGLAACGGGYGGGGGNMPVTGVGASKLFAADSGHKVIGSLANPDPATGSLTVDRVIGPTSPYFYNYAGFSMNIGSLALDATRDYLYVGNGTAILVFHGASMANGDLFTNATIGPIGSTGSLFLDAAGDRLYVGDDAADVKVFSGASMATGTPTPRLITGMTKPIHGVAVDTGRNILYVSNDTIGGSTTHQIMVFDNADTVTNAAPSRTITPTDSTHTLNFTVGGIAIDATRDLLYVGGGTVTFGVMVFTGASAANGSIEPAKVFNIPGVITKVWIDSANDRLYALNSNFIYLIENASTAMGSVTAKAVQAPAGGSFTAITLNQ